MKTYPVAGIDIGTVSIAFVLLDENGRVIHKDYRIHHGNVHTALKDLLHKLPVLRVCNFGVVAEKGREFFKAGIEVNEQVALIAGVKSIYPKPGSIISIGAETFGLILFDHQGRYKKYISNSACAAGTGSFLDQQASRLRLSGSGELSRIAENYTGDPPKIATRCAVFAKTDLVHLQQQGYSLPAIAAGLSQGVAQNIRDTIIQGIELLDPVIVVGGVSKNKKVLACLEKQLNHPLLAPTGGEFMGALGAGLTALLFHNSPKTRTPIVISSLLRNPVSKSYFYEPLSHGKSRIPEFSSWQSSVDNEVETDIYLPQVRHSRIECYIGIDVGSTSTKAALMNPQRDMLAGFYTRTGGRPIAAVQRLTRAIQDFEKKYAINLKIIGSGTTGSGRKFIQKIAGADYAVDEISAHARAAYHVSPQIDTIIEIGGQDAKFTVLNNGNVVFSVMNYVCAAGTGSFIEEQAKRLGVSLQEYSSLAVGPPAPLISDRCTVFMERDLNHLLSLGYSREELLAAALHSVRDNYLSKVAHLNKIGRHVAFQGATAKNHALVKAFEQKLQKPIYVSKFCHLTGAMGVCLKMADYLNLPQSHFRKDLHDEKIIVGEYVCEYCNNNCKIKTTTIDGETLGWGYLCGRDERDAGYKKKQPGGFDLLRNHRKVFTVFDKSGSPKPHTEVNLFQEFKEGGLQAVIRRPGFSLARVRNRIQFNALELRSEIFSSGIVSRSQLTLQEPAISIGLPATLTMVEYLPLWELFFKRLGFVTISSPTNKSYIKAGKEIRGAEYCVPLTEFHGHINKLSPQADFIFYPQILESTTGHEKKAYCYYSHYAVPIIQNIPDVNLAHKMIAPVLTLNGDIDATIRELYLHLPDTIKRRTSFSNVEAAFRLAWDWFRERKKDLQDLFIDQLGSTNDISVVLMGRPYLVLNRSLNMGIPNKLAEMGIQSFHMDMIPIDEEKLDVARDFVRYNHWHYADIIIKTAEMVARTEGVFPIFITAFRCSPDSFIISYFKDIMDYYRKPYLILQLDEHEAGEGYETRLEAAIETFRNFTGAARQKRRPSLTFKKSFDDKTYLLPAFDHLTARLIQAAFIHAGRHVLLVAQTPETIQRSLQFNDGQCLPVSILIQGILHTLEKHVLNPKDAVLLSNSNCTLSCNLPQYPVMIKQTLEKMGHGLEKVEILVSRFLPTDMPMDLMYEIYMAHVLAGLMKKIVYKTRPRGKQVGEVDRIYKQTTQQLFDSFVQGKSKEATFQQIVNTFAAVERTEERLPQVGIIGDLYVRDNEIFNQNLSREIESHGAEAVTIPFHDSATLLAPKHFKNQWHNGQYMNLFKDRLAFNMLNVFNKRLCAIAKPILGNGSCGLQMDSAHYLHRYGLTLSHGGETSENLLKVFYLCENYSDLKVIINVNPIFCCPGLISEAIYKKVEKDIGIPIVSITYDGTQTDKNKVLRPYLHFLNTDSLDRCEITSSI